MRQVWVLSDDVRVESRLSTAFIESRYHVKYRVQSARSISEIPAAHLSDPGVSCFVDAFSSQAPGFEALRQLRAQGFAGPVFMFGEPAPEDAVDPFLKDALTGFLPPLDRCDLFVAAGLVHSFHHFKGVLDLKWFLDTGGKSAVESIASIKDFNQLVLKLMNFVSRFGVNAETLKRSLVALSSSHVKNTPQGPVVSKPFKLSYGLDAAKLMLGVFLDSEELKSASGLEEFGAALAQVKAHGKVGTGHRSDLLNVAKITSNLVYIGGSAGPDPSVDAVLLTSIAFTKGQSSQAEPYFFSYVTARFSNEITDDQAPVIPTEALRFEAIPTPPAPTPLIVAAPPPPLAVLAPAESPTPKKRELFEPNVMGDGPPESLESLMLEAQLNSLGEAGGSATDGAEAPVVSSDPELVAKCQALEAELAGLKSLSEALAADVKRLMKERREPLTNADLKENLNELNVRMKHLQDQNKKLTDIKAQKDAQIELLTAQVERLKMSAA